MKKLISKLGLGVALSAVLLTSCSTVKVSDSAKPDMHTSQNALSWDGIYRGYLPCASCEGIKTTIYLMRDNTYKLVSEYQGEKSGSFESKGKFSWDKTGTIISLNDGDQKNQYKVGENTLTMLDQKGNAITGDLARNYILTKGNYSILNKKWRLTELMGKKITSNETMGKEAFLMLDDKENRYSASVGCNTISAGFELGSFNRLQLKDGISTMMACQNNDLEIQFKDVLKRADSFQVVGDELQLFKGRMAPLAKFKIPMH